MAIIYGCSQSEKEILSRCPIFVENYENISVTHHELMDNLDKKSRIFHEELPNKILEEETSLEKIREHKFSTVSKFDKKIANLQNEIVANKKNKRWFAVSINYPKKWIIEYFSKPGEIRRIEVSERNQKEVLLEWKLNPERIFNQRNNELIDNIEKFNEIKESPFYPGAYGEIEVLKELSKLDNRNYVLCGLNIELEEWHMYNEEHLKSAQMDYIVISNKGIFLIEVKNWSNRYVDMNKGLSPYEQTDRAGRVLYLFLKSKLGYNSIHLRINKVLLPLHNNISYNPEYNSVLVSSLNRITNFIENRNDELTTDEAELLVNILRRYVS